MRGGDRIISLVPLCPHILYDSLCSVCPSASSHWSSGVFRRCSVRFIPRRQELRKEMTEDLISNRQPHRQLRRAKEVRCRWSPKHSSLPVNAAPNTNAHTDAHTPKSPSVTVQPVWKVCVPDEMWQSRQPGPQLTHGAALRGARILTQQAAKWRRRGWAMVKEQGRHLQMGGSVNVLHWGRKGRVLYVCVCVWVCVFVWVGMVCCLMRVELSAHSGRGVHLCNGGGDVRRTWALTPGCTLWGWAVGWCLWQLQTQSGCSQCPWHKWSGSRWSCRCRGLSPQTSWGWTPALPVHLSGDLKFKDRWEQVNMPIVPIARTVTMCRHI